MKLERHPRTDADVTLLLQTFPDLLPDGTRVTHEAIEAVLTLPRASSRYRTVVKNWRGLVFHERRVWLDGRTAEGHGFVALTPDEMVRFSNREVKASGRKLKKAIAVASAPHDDELSDHMRTYRRLLEAAVVKISQEHRATFRDLGKALSPMPQLPRAVSA